MEKNKLLDEFYYSERPDIIFEQGADVEEFSSGLVIADAALIYLDIPLAYWKHLFRKQGYKLIPHEENWITNFSLVNEEEDIWFRLDLSSGYLQINNQEHFFADIDKKLHHLIMLLIFRLLIEKQKELSPLTFKSNELIITIPIDKFTQYLEIDKQDKIYLQNILDNVDDYNNEAPSLYHFNEVYDKLSEGNIQTIVGFFNDEVPGWQYIIFRDRLEDDYDLQYTVKRFLNKNYNADYVEEIEDRTEDELYLEIFNTLDTSDYWQYLFYYDDDDKIPHSSQLVYLMSAIWEDTWRDFYKRETYNEYINAIEEYFDTEFRDKSFVISLKDLDSIHYFYINNVLPFEDFERPYIDGYPKDEDFQQSFDYDFNEYLY